MINYKTLSDADKLDLLRLLYFESTSKEQKNLIIKETSTLLKRIREGSN